MSGGNLKEFERAIEDCRKRLAAFTTRELMLIHHDDADGITSAAIIKTAFERLGYKVKTLCLEKLYPEVVESLLKKKGKLYIFADIASPHVLLISDLNKRRNFVIILDHHDTNEKGKENVYNLNPELYGISGESEASGASVCYLFAKQLDEANKDLAYLAVIGSAEIPGNLRGLNKIALRDAIESGDVEMAKKGEKEVYKITKFDKPELWTSLAKKLTILGAVGYYQRGPEIAIKAALEGFDKETERLVKELEEKRRNVTRKLIVRLRREGLHELKHLQYFHARDAFAGMGVKVIGTFCSYLKFQRWINPRKYLLGFMNMSPEIPGFGKLKGKLVKVSARVPKQLEAEIREKRKPPLSELLPKAAKLVGGFGDGHEFAASGVVPKRKERELCEIFNELVDKS